MVSISFTSVHHFLYICSGEGAFGKVYIGNWRGTPVAVKRMVLPSGTSGMEKRERMAIMEAAISTSLSHPNIVQVSGPRCIGWD